MEPFPTRRSPFEQILAALGIGLFARWIGKRLGGRRGGRDRDAGERRPPIRFDKQADRLAEEVASMFATADIEAVTAALEGTRDVDVLLSALGTSPQKWESLVSEAQQLARDHRAELTSQPNDTGSS